ncbi:MAG: tubulin-like doman-containing protein [Fimbriimonas sp.]|nr:tubulin-like doman-containing protein [Fimbriimonas sp.]
MARKVLLIGIGSTGWELCEQVLEKIELEWGEAKNTPWIKMLAFETDQVEGGGLKRLGTGFRITLTDKDIIALKTNPTQFDRDMNLTAWYDTQVVSQMTANSPGAGGIRQAAKIIFLFPKNATLFHDQVRQSLETLAGLGEGTAKSAAVKSGLPNLDRFALDSPNEILVFLVGSTAGGTGSGTMIEAGYFVRKIARNVGVNVDIKGIALLPPLGDGDVEHKANSYAFLKELNHFQQTHVQWEGAFPIQGMERVTATVGEPPFVDCFVGVPKPGLVKSEALDILIENFAQFIYLSAVGSAANRLNAALINPKNLHATMENIDGCPEAFHSLGVGVIEYPAAQIFKACSCRLGVRLAEVWSKNAPSDEVAKAELARALGLGDASSSDLPVQTSMGSLQSSIDIAVKSSNPSTQLQMIANKVQQEAQAKPGGGSPALGQPVMDTKFQTFVKESLSNIERGPRWLYGVLSKVDTTLESMMGEATAAEKRFKSASTRMTEALNHIREAESDNLVRFIPGWKKIAIQHWAKQYQSALADQVGGSGGLQIRSSVDDSRKALLGDPATNRKGLIEQVKDRLGGDMHDNVGLWLQQFGVECQDEHDRIDSSKFRINGIALFKPGYTVNAAYEESIRTGWSLYTKGSVTGRNPEDSCAATLAARFGDYLTTEVLTSGKSRFDPSDLARPADQDAGKKVWTNSDAQNLRSYTRTLFQGVFKHSVLNELWANEASAEDDLRNVRDNFAKPFIGLNENELRRLDRTPGQDIAPLLGMVPEDNADLRARTVAYIGGKDVSSETWRLAIVRGECMFSLMSIDCVRGENSYEYWYDRQSKGDEPSPGRLTRSAFTLVNLSGVPVQNRARRKIDEGMFLACLGVRLIDPEDLSYKLRDTFGFGGSKERQFTTDIAAAGDMLGEGKGELRKDMERAFDEFKSKDTDGTLVSQRVRDFINRSKNYKLTYKGKLADPSKIADLIVAFAKYKGFWEDIKNDEGIRRFVAEPILVLKADDLAATPKIRNETFTLPGLYCDNPDCGIMLVVQRETDDPSGKQELETEESMRNRLPEICKSCKTVIKNE